MIVGLDLKVRSSQSRYFSATLPMGTLILSVTSSHSASVSRATRHRLHILNVSLRPAVRRTSLLPSKETKSVNEPLSCRGYLRWEGIGGTVSFVTVDSALHAVQSLRRANLISPLSYLAIADIRNIQPKQEACSRQWYTLHC